MSLFTSTAEVFHKSYIILRAFLFSFILGALGCKLYYMWTNADYNDIAIMLFTILITTGIASSFYVKIYNELNTSRKDSNV